MLTSPYPTPDLPAWRVAMVYTWLCTMGAGIWVLAWPPLSYRGIGAGLTVMWGSLLIAGPTLVLIGHLLRRYQIELPGLYVSFSGILIYAYLSWEQILGGTTGAGPRAFMLMAATGWIIGRVVVLRYVRRRLRRLDQIGRG